MIPLSIRRLRVPLIFSMAVSCLSLSSYCLGQDGATFDVRAKQPHAPPLSLVGTPDSLERTTALSELMQGKVEQGITHFRSLAEHGDVPAALLLGGLYRRKTNLPVEPNISTAARFYRLASVNGSGEGSERIAEMIDQKEILAETGQDAAWWRAKARKQGWIQQSFSAHCLDWTHGPEVLRCEPLPLFGADAEQLRTQCPTDVQMDILRGRGMTGLLSPNGGAGGGAPEGSGSTATIFLVVDHAVPSEEDLRQPDGGSVVYVQNPANTWSMFPKDIPLLERFLILTPGGGGRGRMMIMGQNVDTSANGGVCSKFTN